MKKILTLLSILPVAAFAQITVEVEAGGSTFPGQPDPYYDPMDITINVGDNVHWTSVSGSHNVYGGLDDFPDNPEAFSSGQPTSDLDYTRTFNVPGLYGYHCTQNGHAATQHGTILVLDGSNVEEIDGMGRLTLFPVPVNGQLIIDLDGNQLIQADVHALDGRMLRSVPLANVHRVVIDVQDLAPGRYLLRITDKGGRSLARPFIKD